MNKYKYQPNGYKPKAGDIIERNSVEPNNWTTEGKLYIMCSATAYRDDNGATKVHYSSKWNVLVTAPGTTAKVGDTVMCVGQKGTLLDIGTITVVRSIHNSGNINVLANSTGDPTDFVVLQQDEPELSITDHIINIANSSLADRLRLRQVLLDNEQTLSGDAKALLLPTLHTASKSYMCHDLGEWCTTPSDSNISLQDFIAKYKKSGTIRNLAFYKESGENWTEEELDAIDSFTGNTTPQASRVSSAKFNYDDGWEDAFQFAWGKQDKCNFMNCLQVSYEDVFPTEARNGKPSATVDPMYSIWTDFLSDIQQIGENHLYEPSERGSGYCVSDDGIAEQQELTGDFIAEHFPNGLVLDNAPLNEFDFNSVELFEFDVYLQELVPTEATTKDAQMTEYDGIKLGDRVTVSAARDTEMWGILYGQTLTLTKLESRMPHITPLATLTDDTGATETCDAGYLVLATHELTPVSINFAKGDKVLFKGSTYWYNEAGGTSGNHWLSSTNRLKPLEINIGADQAHLIKPFVELPTTTETSEPTIIKEPIMTATITYTEAEIKAAMTGKKCKATKPKSDYKLRPAVIADYYTAQGKFIETHRFYGKSAAYDAQAHLVSLLATNPNAKVVPYTVGKTSRIKHKFEVIK